MKVNKICNLDQIYFPNDCEITTIYKLAKISISTIFQMTLTYMMNSAQVIHIYPVELICFCYCIQGITGYHHIH